MDARSSTNGLLAKDKVMPSKPIALPSVMDFTLHDAIGTVLMKMKLVGNKEWSRSMIPFPMIFISQSQ
jgi:hypothetical protein